jgi:hypothetical protein
MDQAALSCEAWTRGAVAKETMRQVDLPAAARMEAGVERLFVNLGGFYPVLVIQGDCGSLRVQNSISYFAVKKVVVLLPVQGQEEGRCAVWEVRLRGPRDDLTSAPTDEDNHRIGGLTS